jgi:hypothetical protein
MPGSATKKKIIKRSTKNAIKLMIRATITEVVLVFMS